MTPLLPMHRRIMVSLGFILAWGTLVFGATGGASTAWQRAVLRLCPRLSV
jgi:hypothetical protein